MIKGVRITVGLSIILTALLILKGCDKDEDLSQSGITITDIFPANGSAGTLITIKGEGFAPVKDNNLVKINGKEAVVVTSTVSEMIIEVPEDCGTGTVTVTVGSRTATGPTFTYEEGVVSKPYYIKFKVNGSWKVFEDTNPGYQACGQCSCSYIPALNESRNSGIDICQAENNWVTAADILGWNQKRIPFSSDNGFPIASFGYEEDDITYHSDYVADQDGSEIHITSIVSDGTYMGKNAYKVSGTFKCKVSKSGDSSADTITEGQFVIRYTEDF